MKSKTEATGSEINLLTTINGEAMQSVLKKMMWSMLLIGMAVMAWAQPKLSISSAWSLPSDTAVFNGNPYILSMGVVVENIGNAKLDGPVSIFMRYNGDTIDYLKDEFTAVDFEVGMQEQVDFNDTISNISGLRYKGGDNILVIWPKSDAPGVLAPDSASISIYVKDIRLSSTDTEDLIKGRVKVYPNPVVDKLNLDIFDQAHKLEYVRIYNAAGQLIHESTQAFQALDVHAWPGQVFMMEIRFRDGVQGVFRILK